MVTRNSTAAAPYATRLRTMRQAFAGLTVREVTMIRRRRLPRQRLYLLAKRSVRARSHLIWSARAG
jgi:hypothetical protein